MNAIRAAVLALLAVLVAAAPAAAYTIYLKDGSRITAREEYKVIDGTAYIVMPNGTTTFLDAAEIDVPRTEAANQQKLGSALVLEGGKVREMTAEDAQKVERRRTLADLIASRQDGGPVLPEVRRADSAPAEGELSLTPGGYPDLGALPPRPLGDLDLAAQIQQMYVAQGLEMVEVLQGTAPDRPRVMITTGSEASVFRALAVTCAALMRLRDTSPGAVGAIELVMATPDRQAAGQFVITPDIAAQLMSKQVDIATFYLAHVRF